jgi:hypothetical protein
VYSSSPGDLKEYPNIDHVSLHFSDTISTYMISKLNLAVFLSPSPFHPVNYSTHFPISTFVHSSNLSLSPSSLANPLCHPFGSATRCQ